MKADGKTANNVLATDPAAAFQKFRDAVGKLVQVPKSEVNGYKPKRTGKGKKGK